MSCRYAPVYLRRKLEAPCGSQVHAGSLLPLAAVGRTWLECRRGGVKTGNVGPMSLLLVEISGSAKWHQRQIARLIMPRTLRLAPLPRFGGMEKIGPVVAARSIAVAGRIVGLTGFIRGC